MSTQRSRYAMVPWILFIVLLFHGFSLAGGKRLILHVIDVGQADSLLVQTPDGHSLLVDGGNDGDAPVINAYIKRQGVKRLDYVIATHPHEDHIGGLDEVVGAFPVGTFLMPNKAHTTKAFKDLVDAVNASGARKVMAKAGVVLDIPGVSAKLLSPGGTGYEELNDYSAVLRLQYGNTVFLLTGDAGGTAEGEMLKAYPKELRADVLKVGHHGSRTSSSAGFLNAVMPKVALVSAGKGNDYGHPHAETLERLRAINATVLRTDLAGDLVVGTDGRTVTVDKPTGTVALPPTTATPIPTAGNGTAKPVANAVGQRVERTVYITDTGSKYHRDGCRYLRQSRRPIKLSQALAAGYEACSVCKP